MTEPAAPSPSSETPPRGLWFWIATFFGSGLFPVAPGTAGTVASLVLWAPAVLLDWPWYVRLALVVASFAIGVPACSSISKTLQKDDPKEAVIDEVAGQGLTLLVAGPLILNVVVGFALFRLFDIWKPWPVRWADQKVHGGLGVMLDDIIAGGYAIGFLIVLELYVWPLLPAVLRTPVAF